MEQKPFHSRAETGEFRPRFRPILWRRGPPQIYRPVGPIRLSTAEAPKGRLPEAERVARRREPVCVRQVSMLPSTKSADTGCAPHRRLNCAFYAPRPTHEIRATCSNSRFKPRFRFRSRSRFGLSRKHSSGLGLGLRARVAGRGIPCGERTAVKDRRTFHGFRLPLESRRLHFRGISIKAGVTVS